MNALPHPETLSSCAPPGFPAQRQTRQVLRENEGIRAEFRPGYHCRVRPWTAIRDLIARPSPSTAPAVSMSELETATLRPTEKERFRPLASLTSKRVCQGRQTQGASLRSSTDFGSPELDKRSGDAQMIRSLSLSFWATRELSSNWPTLIAQSWPSSTSGTKRSTARNSIVRSGWCSRNSRISGMMKRDRIQGDIVTRRWPRRDAVPLPTSSSACCRSSRTVSPRSRNTCPSSVRRERAAVAVK